jgi:hypothetical protein
MKVICINNDFRDQVLTVGKEYEAEVYNVNHYELTDDQEMARIFPKVIFKLKPKQTLYKQGDVELYLEANGVELVISAGMKAILLTLEEWAALKKAL